VKFHWKPVKIYWKPVQLHWMTSATALKFPVAPGSLELARRVGFTFSYEKKKTTLSDLLKI